MPQLALDFNDAVCQFPTAGQLGITDRQNQLRLVYECFRQGGEYTFDDIRAYCKVKGELYRETSISARIRELNPRLVPRGLVIRHRYEKPGSTNTIYSLKAST